MEIERQPFQGLWNILRFNWHFYIVAIASVLVLLFISQLLDRWEWVAILISLLISVPVIISLCVSYYVYDLSDLYRLKWLDGQIKSGFSILNVNAGFDETSRIICAKDAGINLEIADFYDADRHTEVSIKRARKIYPPSPDCIKIETSTIPYPDNSFDTVCVFFAAHEIRNFEERLLFFRELSRVTKPQGKLFITEHLRDLPNFLAYTFGFFHFYSGASWTKIFEESNLKKVGVFKSTNFVSTFILEPNGIAS